MGKKAPNNWFKHFDFILIDVICLLLSLMISYWILHGLSNPFGTYQTRYQALIIHSAQLIAIVFFEKYSGILRRKTVSELISVITFAVQCFLIAIVFLFITRTSIVASRLQFGLTYVLFIVLDVLIRELNKRRILLYAKKNKRSIVVITVERLATEAIQVLEHSNLGSTYLVFSVILLDYVENKNYDRFAVPVYPATEEAMRFVSHNWVDEAFVLQPEEAGFPKAMIDQLLNLGIIVQYSIEGLTFSSDRMFDVNHFGKYNTLSFGLNMVSTRKLAVKRVADILGGIIGCIATGLIFLFVAPLIYRKSPGPIFFAQKRVGQNGKIFTLYKFRSMYLDAEDRKKELMDQNELETDLMFKIEDDPRIIGSEMKDKRGRPKGIGNFIRRTSLDEFPQFFNVLKGDMSLVGTRPPTQDEWVQYDLQHRIRMSAKPGITGMWQVNGRNQVIDFDEVVRLDKEYIENWSLLLDAKILMKTVKVVFSGTGK